MIKKQLEKQIEEKKKEVKELLKEANEFYINNEFTMAKNRYRRGYHSAKDLEELYEQIKDSYPIELYENMFIIAIIQYKYSICLINIAEDNYSNYEKEIWNKPCYFNYIERSIKALKEGLKYIYEISYSRNIDYLSIKRDILYNLAFAYYKYNDMSNALIYITIAEEYIDNDNKKKEINELKENIKCYLEAQINKEL